jgi:hypothetical protein
VKCLSHKPINAIINNNVLLEKNNKVSILYTGNIFKKSIAIPYLHVQGYWSDGDTVEIGSFHKP